MSITFDIKISAMRIKDRFGAVVMINNKKYFETTAAASLEEALFQARQTLSVSLVKLTNNLK